MYIAHFINAGYVISCLFLGEGHSESEMLGRLCRCINQANGIIRYRDAPYPVNLYDMHYCANGNRGVADFVGFKRVNADE